MDTIPHNPSSRLTRAQTGRDLGWAPEQFLWLMLSHALWVGLCVLAAMLSPSVAHAQTLMSKDVLQTQVEGLLKTQSLPQGADKANGSAPMKPWRIELVLGELDPRLRLAPCDKVHAYMPDGVQLWGRTRVGLRCEVGAVHWNVSWPVTVKVWGQALVPVVPLRPGAPVEASDLRMAEVDLAAFNSPAVTRLEEAVGRSVLRSVEPGQSLREADLRARRWFEAGDPVKMVVKGDGFSVAAEGLALTPGDEGRCARIRTDSGRIVCGQPVGARQVELSL
jgi:flagella basal body P-ring formation protein FlgA